MAIEELRVAKLARMELEADLKALTSPQFEYELALPEQIPNDEKEKEEKNMDMAPDMADVKKEDQRKRQK